MAPTHLDIIQALNGSQKIYNHTAQVLPFKSGHSGTDTNKAYAPILTITHHQGCTCQCYHSNSTTVAYSHSCKRTYGTSSKVSNLEHLQDCQCTHCSSKDATKDPASVHNCNHTFSNASTLFLPSLNDTIQLQIANIASLEDSSSTTESRTHGTGTALAEGHIVLIGMGVAMVVFMIIWLASTCWARKKGLDHGRAFGLNV
jgi:hypothetical protein